MAFAILSLLGFLAFALISIPFFFPFRFSEKSIEGIGALAMVVLLGHVLSGIGQFFANFSIPTPHIGES
jgi:drug/metabolite transporter (DMT)-like permease